jgi:4-hydroxy-3-methylbut-2-enyl diphosphate reductase
MSQRKKTGAFSSAVVDRVRRSGNVWQLSGGEIHLPGAFGFCRGVERALEMLEAAVDVKGRDNSRLFLLGDIIHNPWVNDYFRARGVNVLSAEQRDRLEEVIGPDDCAVIPAFGVSPPIERRLEAIGCEIIDTTCGDVRRLWKWAEHAVAEGFNIMIFGRALHDETVVTKARLAEAGGRYVVAGNLEQVRQLAAMIAGDRDARDFGQVFSAQATNADSLDEFAHLAQVSQTTMLYDQTMEVRRVLTDAFSRRFGQDDLERRLLLQPTVCRATQARQTAAVEMCRLSLDLVIVVGGFGSSNTRHLFELARQYAPAYFIESAQAIRGPDLLESFDIATEKPTQARNWLGEKRPLKIGVLAGASTPESVVGEVLERLAEFLQ